MLLYSGTVSYTHLDVYKRQQVTADKPQEKTVYITATGNKYHRASCRYLEKSKISIDLSDALAAGYGACKVCRPCSDFDGDGHPDLIVGDEDGRVAWVRHTGKVKKGIPQFESPLYLSLIHI